MAPHRTGWVRGLTRRSFHRIAFRDWGPSSAAPPVLCVHGLTRNGRISITSQPRSQMPGVGPFVRICREGTERMAAGSRRLRAASVLQRHDRIDGRAYVTEIDWIGTRPWAG
jgi:hypothetical protein